MGNQFSDGGRIIKGYKETLNLSGGKKEIDIQKEFSKHFGVTFSKQAIFKKSEYVYAFLQPGDIFLNNFNMSNEVLLLFSKYNNFDNRIFDYIDKLQGEYENRIDKVCIILISADEEIEDKIKKINAERKDSKIVVPFSYNELNNGLDKSILDSRLREFFYSRDLFALESPITNNAYFFGRKKIVQDLFSNYRNGEQSGLFGLRKIGKTSVLYALDRMIETSKGAAIYIDCQSPSVHQLNWNELLYQILCRLKEKYKLVTDIPEESMFTEKRAANLFSNSIKSMSNELGCRVLIIFDEIESISVETSPTSHWKTETDFLFFWQTIRALIQENQDVISFLIAGVNPFCIETIQVSGVDNPIYSMAQPTYLELFSYEEVKDMLSNIGKYMGLSYDEELFSVLMHDYGGHPFLIRHACSILNKDIGHTRPVNIGKLDYEQLKEKIDSEMNKYIDQIVSVLERYYVEEYDLLKVLILEGSDKFLDKIGTNLNYINHLEGYSFILKHRAKYHIRLNSLSVFMYKKYGIMPENEFEKKIHNVSLKRNRLEKKLREYIKNVYHSNFGNKMIKNKVLQCKSKDEREKLQNLSVQNIFDEKLYFIDLKNLIAKEWALFDKIFMDKQKFINSMDFINAFRIDAHAKEIEEAEYSYLIHTLDQMEKLLEM